MRPHHKRVPLAREYRDLIDRQRFGVLAVGLDDGHGVPGDREGVVRVASHVEQAKPVAGEENRSCQIRCIEHSRKCCSPLPLGDLNDRQLRRRITVPAAQAVDESRIRPPTNPHRIGLNPSRCTKLGAYGAPGRVKTSGDATWYQSASVMIVLSAA